jgi:hypothetical protein
MEVRIEYIGPSRHKSKYIDVYIYTDETPDYQFKMAWHGNNIIETENEIKLYMDDRYIGVIEKYESTKITWKKW